MPGAGEDVATRRGGSRSAIARRADRLAGRVPANVARREKTALRCSHPGVRYDPANLVPDGGRYERRIRLQTHVDEDPFRRVLSRLARDRVAELHAGDPLIANEFRDRRLSAQEDSWLGGAALAVDVLGCRTFRSLDDQHLGCEGSKRQRLLKP